MGNCVTQPGLGDPQEKNQRSTQAVLELGMGVLKKNIWYAEQNISVSSPVGECFEIY